MPLPLLAFSFPLLAQFGTELAGLTVTYFSVGWAIWLYYQKRADERQKTAEEKAAIEKKREVEETDKIRQAAYVRIEKLESSVKTFIDKEKLDERFTHLGKQVADNQGAIKTTHDRGEEVANKLDMRVSSLEQNHSQLAGLPAQVQRLNTDHAILSSKVDAISTNLDKIERKQDENFRLLFDAVKDIARTQGQLEK